MEGTIFSHSTLSLVLLLQSVQIPLSQLSMIVILWTQGQSEKMVSKIKLFQPCDQLILESVYIFFLPWIWFGFMAYQPL